MSAPSILLEAYHWSEIPGLMDAYHQRIGSEGIMNIFVYGSLAFDHPDIKAESPEAIKNDYTACLHGSVVAMNVLAHGERALRGSMGTYIDKEGRQRTFCTTGMYVGLEPTDTGHAQGVNLTIAPEGREKAWYGYMKCELAEPPEGITYDDILKGQATDKLKALQGTEADKLGMYKLQIVEVQTSTGPAFSITVSTNDKSPFARIGMTSMQAAYLVLNGQGIRREINGAKMGGAALDYFKFVWDDMKQLGFRQERIIAIANALEPCAIAMEKSQRILGRSKGNNFKIAGIEAVSSRYPGFSDIVSPLLLVPTKDGIIVPQERRPEIPAEVVDAQKGNFAFTPEEQTQRIAMLRKRGELRLTL